MPLQVLDQVQSFVKRKSRKGLPDVKGRSVPVVISMVLFAETGFTIEFPGEQTACQWEANDYSNALFRSFGKKILPVVLSEQVEDDLLDFARLTNNFR